MNEIMEAAKKWFREKIVVAHIKNTEKLIDIEEFTINPFTTKYLANFLTGNSSSESIAKILIYPRILGTSISTTFGSQAKYLFTDQGIGSFGSGISGIDIEFIDNVDGRRKYCQVKAGPQTINKDDVESINGHFKKLRGIAKTNNLALEMNDLIVGVIYGTKEQLSYHYNTIEEEFNYPVFVGKDFWHRLTGEENFYNRLIDELSGIAEEFNSEELINDTIAKLAQHEKIK